ncbi:MAG: preprotein translocase subunit SecE [Phycisphaerae bacterium]|nr:preprotein translocase subunit SecE [Phycisphaerae bacterium]
MGFHVYKRGQGKNTRLWSALIVAAIVGIGCLQLYKKLAGTDLNQWVVYFVPAGLFAILSYVVFWLSNKPSLADFMISAEGELKKVSWSSRQEIVVSTVIVIAVVVFMAGLLGATDLMFRTLFTSLLG